MQRRLRVLRTRLARRCPCSACSTHPAGTLCLRPVRRSASGACRSFLPRHVCPESAACQRSQLVSFHSLSPQLHHCHASPGDAAQTRRPCCPGSRRVLCLAPHCSSPRLTRLSFLAPPSTQCFAVLSSAREQRKVCVPGLLARSTRSKVTRDHQGCNLKLPKKDQAY